MTSSADAAVDQLVQILVDMRDLLRAHGQDADFVGLSNLGAIATEPGDAAERLRRVSRHRMRMGHPGGVRDLYIADRSGGVDRVASGRLVELRERMDAIIEEWGPRERDE